MSERDDIIYLRHIRDAIAKIEEYHAGVDEVRFRRDSLVQDGFIRQIQIIGEAVRRLSPGLCSRYPAVPWQDIAGMRNKLVHDYFGVDLEAVWLTITQDVPVLKVEIEGILDELAP